MKVVINKICLLLCIAIVVESCKKFVEVPPPSTQLTGPTVYLSNATAASAISGIYQTMYSSAIGGGLYGTSALLGLASDEIGLFPNPDEIYNLTFRNDLLSTTNVAFWGQYYNIIYQANSAVDGITKSTGVSAVMKQQLLGEVKFTRAFCYFYLTNIYGDVPLVTTTDYKTNSSVARVKKIDVNQLIFSDLKDAQNSLSNDYLNPDGSVSTTRVRPNKATATALLARYYLFQQKWDSAEAEAAAVISNSNFQLDTTLTSTFLATGNKEAIWQLETPNNGGNAPDGAFLYGYYYGGPASYFPFFLNADLANSFENGDLRKLKWTVSSTFNGTHYYFPYKYKLLYTGQPPQEYPVVFRLAEQYLIRAEARAQQGRLTDAISDLNVIRKRAGLQNTNAVTQQQVLAAILIESRHELFTEYGNRWFDLIRTGNADSYMSVITPLKGGSWQPTDKLLPIPATEIQRNPRLTQNLGYQ